MHKYAFRVTVIVVGNRIGDEVQIVEATVCFSVHVKAFEKGMKQCSPSSLE